MIAVFLAMVAYTIPWSVTPIASLNLGANDLAEWASLHPAARASSLPLLVSLLLRLPLVFLAFIVAFSIPGPPRRSSAWWLGALFVVVIVLLLLPPLEFLTSARGDKNYQQQSVLVIIAVAGSVLGCSGLGARLRPMIVVTSALAGACVSGIGFQKADTLIKDFGISVQLGGGVGLTILLFMVIIAVEWQLILNRVACDNSTYPVSK
jgi:hypothetical protein